MLTYHQATDWSRVVTSQTATPFTGGHHVTKQTVWWTLEKWDGIFSSLNRTVSHVHSKSTGEILGSPSLYSFTLQTRRTFGGGGGSSNIFVGAVTVPVWPANFTLLFTRNLHHTYILHYWSPQLFIKAAYTAGCSLAVYSLTTPYSPPSTRSNKPLGHLQCVYFGVTAPRP
jgi:hypothetical protein